MVKQKKLALAVHLASLGLVGSLFSSITAVAQEQDEEGATAMEEVFVTGSRIRRIDNETVSPVVSISSEDIESIGFTSVQEVLSDLPQNAGGSLDQQQVFGFTPAASAVDLRGAGEGRSLTLINGKRLPKYPIPAGGTDNFVDTANIPLGAVERVEVLTSGASAIYGSDAMGGVVNIILKEEFEGFEIKGKYGDSKGGGAELKNISIVAGANSDTSKMMFFLEHDSKGVLHARQRNRFDNLGSDLAFDSPFGAYSSYGVSIRDVFGDVAVTLPEGECVARGLQPTTTGGLPNCGFNRSARRDLFPEMERTSALINFSMELSDSMEMYSRFDYTWSSSARDIEPMAVDNYTYYVGIDVNEDPDPGNVTLVSDLSGAMVTYDQATGFGGDFAGLDDGIYYPTRRMLEFGNRQGESETNNYTLLSGVRGELDNGWHWDFDWQFSRTDFGDRNYGYASADLYFAYLASGTNGRSVFDIMTEEEVAEASYIPWTDAQSTFTGFSATIDGEMFSLPAGDISWAFGAESYKEWFYNTADSESIKGNILTTGGSSGEGARDYFAIFAESLLPVTDNIAATFALRYDDFSDFGNNTSPQLGLEYRPTDSILVRALYADTFRAPDMQRVYGDPTLAFDQIVDPYGCQQQGGTVGPTSPIAACNGELYVDVAVGPNADLGAEQGNNWNIGVVMDLGDFNASIDYWGMEIEDIVNDLSAQDIANDYQTYESLITRNAAGEVELVNATAQNLSFRDTSGVDFTFGYKLPLEDLGQLRFKLTGSYLLKYEEQFDLNSEVEDVIAGDRVPEWRMQFSTGWDIGAFTTNLYINYIGSMNGAFIDEYGEFLDSTTIDSSYRVNLSTAYIADSFTVQVGVNNLFDEGPKLDPTEVGWPYYAQEYHNALGQNYYVSASYKFE